MSEQQFAHLGLQGWPFNRAGPLTAELWIGRPEVERRLQLFLRSAARVSASQLMLLWADLGAGKTQALRHTEWLASEERDLIAIYVTTPRGISSFFDVYRAVIDSAIDSGALHAAGRDLFERTRGHVSSDVERAIIRIGMYEEEDARIAQAWLRGEAVQRQANRELDVTARVRSAADAIDALDDLIRILRRDDRTVLFLLDEVQELADLDSRRQAEAVGGLHKVFDRHPDGLAMMLSFTTASQDTMRSIIGGPLSDRANGTISLPSIDAGEACELVVGLVSHWSVNPSAAPAPFEEDAIAAVVSKLEGALPHLTPRSVITAFDAILREADFDIERGEIDRISASYALEHLGDGDGGPRVD